MRLMIMLLRIDNVSCQTATVVTVIVGYLLSYLIIFM